MVEFVDFDFFVCAIRGAKVVCGMDLGLIIKIKTQVSVSCSLF